MTTPDSRPTSKVLADVLVERNRQIDLGWTREHDDRHTIDDLVRLADRQARKAGPWPPGYFSRRRLVEAAALLVAAVELMDRLEEAGR